MPQSSPQSKPVDGVVKHRACDECRSRKLACTKEPDGCSRCKRDGLRCVYSPQKQMGRPRKRRHVEEPEEEPSLAKPQTADQQLQMPLVTQATLDADFSALFTQDYSNINYLELLSPLEGLPPSTLPPELSSLTMAYAEPRYSTGDFQFGVGGVDLLGGINFDESDSTDEDLPQDINNSFTDMLLAHVPETAPIVSPPTSSEISHTLSTSISIPESPSSANTNADDGINQEPEPAIKPYNNTSCSCLSQIFLSLDSLSRLPNDVKIAMAIARSAARVAHDVIHCPACSLTDITKPPPMQAFQNTMMLGAILPSTANAYAKILELIDSEAAQAKKEGRCIKFCFAEYGGLWGELRRRGKTCGAMDLIDNREMDPDDWRLSVRGLLKIDVYGHDFEKNNGMGTAEPYHHLGLRDVIKEMEDRSNNRHNQLDDMVAAGLPHPMLQTSHNLMIPQGQTDRKEDRHCLKIIEIARVALDKLVIA
ncbi:C6 finger domain-containing protein [Colletotrichum higginsianum IMI 349063]|uniref:C6 finger domain-containing protein n=3 Tax=Colletotrichum higginsianum TaxID=80884 RepID=A0A1B7YUD2_COLHI|nr:C6 finger domain-containing protein [Colletotrichum higginsianum IMI 349063]OBR15562.1 C6 finger domain-containing protein [Colletotrichum higginsianum IMI 349063]